MADSNLSSCINFTVFSLVMVYLNKNVGGLLVANNRNVGGLKNVGDLMFLFVSQTSTFDSPNSLYFKILGFIR